MKTRLTRRHEGNPWKVYATDKDGRNVVRVTDGAGVRRMAAEGYTIHRVVEQKPEPMDAGWPS